LIDGHISRGDMLSFLIYTIQVMGGLSVRSNPPPPPLQVAHAFGAFGNRLSSFVRGIGASDRIFQILATPRAERDPAALVLDSRPSEIEFRDVHFFYPARPDVPVLRGISLRFVGGTTTAVTGASGGGKSTLVALILRFYDASSGAITVDGRPISALCVDWLRRNVGYVAQEPVLFSFSVKENLLYAAGDDAEGRVDGAVRAVGLQALISQLPNGLDTVGKRGGEGLS
jgi:ABC-type multidrug transport system fused ATPase/permease subunit